MDEMERFRQKCRAFFAPMWPAEERVLVFGEGRSERPQVMLIGEAPGEQETLKGRPFVGKAGKNLDEFLAAVALRREEIYISNVVKVRPVKVSAKGTVSNRPPNREELALFTPFLYEEIALVKPEMIVTLGNTALQALMGKETTIGDVHGRVCRAEIPAQKGTMEARVFPLYHPASIIYNRALKSVYEQDLAALSPVLHPDESSARGEL